MKSSEWILLVAQAAERCGGAGDLARRVGVGPRTVNRWLDGSVSRSQAHREAVSGMARGKGGGGRGKRVSCPCCGAALVLRAV